MALNYSNMRPIFSFRNETGYTELEKRQLFLRSYQFSRKQSVPERIRRSYFRVKRVIWVRFRSMRKLKKMLWLKLKNGLLSFTARRRRLFRRLSNYNQNCSKYKFYLGVKGSRTSAWESTCLC
ncbi:uncharacterized protein [Primulina huaijiensis]|uniref:uncharacterized protein n=1 Tax=Primulina huaijiensis TaxID=1492673 RepID=UPI003CC6FF44